jgi:hypothetical protein
VAKSQIQKVSFLPSRKNMAQFLVNVDPCGPAFLWELSGGAKRDFYQKTGPHGKHTLYHFLRKHKVRSVPVQQHFIFTLMGK